MRTTPNIDITNSIERIGRFESTTPMKRKRLQTEYANRFPKVSSDSFESVKLQ